MSWKYRADEFYLLRDLNTPSWIRGKALNFSAAVGQFGLVAADVPVATTAYVNIGGLSFAIGKGETWFYEAVLAIAGATNGVKFQTTGPASPTSVLIAESGNTSGLTAYASDTVAAFSTPGATAFATSAVTGTYRQFGTIVNGTTAGTVQLQFATASGTNSVSVKLGSFLRAQRIG